MEGSEGPCEVSEGFGHVRMCSEYNQMCFIAQRSTLIAQLEDTIYEVITVVNDLDSSVKKHLLANSEVKLCQGISRF